MATHAVQTMQNEDIVLMEVSSDQPGKTNLSYQERSLKAISEQLNGRIGGNVLLFSCTQSVINGELWENYRQTDPFYTGHAMMFYGQMALGELILDPELSISFTKTGFQSHEVALGRLFPGKDDEIERNKFGSKAYIIAVPESATRLNKEILKERLQEIRGQNQKFNLANNACIHTVCKLVTNSIIKDVSTQSGLDRTLTKLFDIASTMNEKQEEALLTAMKKLKLNRKGDELGKDYQDKQKPREETNLSEISHPRM